MFWEFNFSDFKDKTYSEVIYEKITVTGQESTSRIIEKAQNLEFFNSNALLYYHNKTYFFYRVSVNLMLRLRRVI